MIYYFFGLLKNCLPPSPSLFHHRTLMKSAPESIQSSVHSFFKAAASDLEMTVETLSETLVSLPQSKVQLARGVANVLNYTTSILLPTLTSLFLHLANQNYGVDLLGKSCFCIGKERMPYYHMISFTS